MHLHILCMLIALHLVVQSHPLNINIQITRLFTLKLQQNADAGNAYQMVKCQQQEWMTYDHLYQQNYVGSSLEYAVLWHSS